MIFKTSTIIKLLWVVAILVGAFIVLEPLFYESFFGQELLTHRNMQCFARLDRAKRDYLMEQGVLLTDSDDGVHLSYVTSFEGFTVHEVPGERFAFTFTEDAAATKKFRKSKTFDRRKANQVVDHILPGPIKEMLLTMLELR